MLTKVCTKCGAAKSIDAYAKQKLGRDGRRANCRDCERDYRAANRERIAERKRASYEANREYISEYHRRYRAENRERVLARKRNYRRQNREKVLEGRREWGARNPERLRESNERRRAVKAQVSAEPVDTDALWQHYGGNCPLCFTKIDRALSYPDPMSASLDHAVPLSKGGTHTQGNLQWTHLTCNVRKGNRD